jgi:hypothetical protein
MEEYGTNNLNYPELKQYLEDLETLRNYEFKDSNIEDIYNKFHDLALTIPVLGAKFLAKEINGRKFYRVRLKKKISEEEDKSLIQTFSYPPPNVCNFKGRANIIKKSVFYCTDKPYPAIMESNPEVGDEGYLSIWEINASRNLHYICCLPENLPFKNEWYEYGTHHHNFLIQKQSELNKGELQYKIALRKLITERFINEKYPYHISSMLSNEFLYFNQADILMYPSAKTLQDYTNFAIHPNSVNNHIFCKKVVRFKVIKDFGTYLRLSFKSTGHLIDDRFHWKEFKDEDGKELGFEKNVEQ